MITKIDIMDQGTDAASMLRGEDVPLRLGYVGVKMRSQQDIVNKKPAARPRGARHGHLSGKSCDQQAIETYCMYIT